MAFDLTVEAKGFEEGENTLIFNPRAIAINDKDYLIEYLASHGHCRGERINVTLALKKVDLMSAPCEGGIFTAA